MHQTLTALLVAVFFASFTVPASAQQPDAAVESLVKGNNDFAAALYQRLAEKDGNLFFSPYSISNALAMTYAGARGTTADEMRATLRFVLDNDKLHPAFGKLIAKLDGEGKKRPFQLNVANRLWGQQAYGFFPEFLKTGQDSYRAGLEEVDFVRATEDARKTINNWVEKQTQGKIKDLIPQGVLDDRTRLVLTNAIYFKAAWLNPFNAKQTRPGAFNVAADKSVQIPMMQGNQRMNFAQQDAFSLIEIPYVGYNQSMIVLLPKQKDGLRELEKKLTGASLAAWTSMLSDHMVNLKLPKFKVTAEFKLKDVLMQMGMKDAFTFGKADFTGMASHEKLYLSAVLHKAFVDVNEAGTEAAASTAAVIGNLSLPQPATFIADRPFLFLIRDRQTGSILFMGRVANPAANS